MAHITGGQGVRVYLDTIASRVTRPATLRVGFLEGATYPDGTPVAMVAAIQNWGAPKAGIPPRPFFGNLIVHHDREWGPAIGQLLAANGYDAAKTLAQVGEAVSGQLKQEIVDLMEPPLAPATVKRKGFSKPLIDHAIMLGAVDYEVK